MIVSNKRLVLEYIISQVPINRAAGNTFEWKTRELMETIVSGVVQQVTISMQSGVKT